MNINLKRLIIKILCFNMLILVLSSDPVFAKPEVSIGSKPFSESIILSELISQLLESSHASKMTSFEVHRKQNLGGTKVCFDALKIGDIDIYPEYTGTAYTMILKHSEKKTSQKVYQTIQKELSENDDLFLSKPLGFNNTYALAVRSEDPRFKNINNISQLAPLTSKLKLGTHYEFMDRPDGYNNLSKTYKLKFKAENIKTMDSGLMYSAIKNKSVDTIVSYSTDGRILRYNLKLLNDDKKFFPPYEVVYMVRQEFVEEHPEVLEAFENLEGNISQKEMVEMNDQVSRLQLSPSQVARDFLIKKKLLKPMAGFRVGAMRSQSKSFFKYSWEQRKYLKRIFIEHLYLTFSSLILAILVALPLGVFMTRSKLLAQMLFPVINILQTIPSLALLGFLIPFVGIGFTPALVALFVYSLLPLVRNTYTGIVEVDPLLIEASRGVGLTNLQILKKVELPLALPVILAGVRTATVIIVGTATLAALVGAGGLGDPILRGVATVNSNLILLGAIPAGLLAIIMDKLIGYGEDLFVSPGLK